MRAVELKCETCKAPPGTNCKYRPGRLRTYCKARTQASRRITGTANAKRKKSGKTRAKAPDRPNEPDIAVQLYLVGHGYQIDIFNGGLHLGSSCRDFSDSYKIEQLKVSFIEMFGEALKEWRSKL